MFSLTEKGYYVPTDTKQLAKHKKALQIVPWTPYTNKQYRGYKKPIVLYTFARPAGILVPRYYGLEHFGKPKIDTLSNQEIRVRKSMTFKGSLRDYQVPIVSKCMDHMRAHCGGVLCISPGMGKTCCALYMACQWKCKTMIIVHTSTLLNQWKERVHQFVPNASIGIVQGPLCETDAAYDICIGMVHSLSYKPYAPDAFKSFQLVVYDEIDRMCTQVFSKSFAKVAAHAKYTMGLSATPRREDRCERIFYAYIGPIMHEQKRDPDESVKVYVPFVHHKQFEPCRDKNGEISYTNTVIKMSKMPHRNHMLAQRILDLAKHPDRKILVLGAYINQLEDLLARLPKGMGSLYIGRMNEQERARAQTFRVILGTYSIASVGMDIPALNTLVFATPRKQIEQAVGRIMRKLKATIYPVIVDPVDSFYYFVAQSKKRITFYRKNGYQIIHEEQQQQHTAAKKTTLVDFLAIQT
ncbi:hypothetical protein CL622_03750 [archaeon]|nr:hypothetical protein [archaeon]